MVLGHADLIISNVLSELKDDYPNLKIAQWFLDPLNKKDLIMCKIKKILDKTDNVDANFITTSQKALDFFERKDNNFFIPNPSDPSFETLNNFNTQL